MTPTSDPSAPQAQITSLWEIPLSHMAMANPLFGGGLIGCGRHAISGQLPRPRFPLVLFPFLLAVLPPPLPAATHTLSHVDHPWGFLTDGRPRK